MGAHLRQEFAEDTGSYIEPNKFLEICMNQFLLALFLPSLLLPVISPVLEWLFITPVIPGIPLGVIFRLLSIPLLALLGIWIGGSVQKVHGRTSRAFHHIVFISFFGGLIGIFISFELKLDPFLNQWIIAALSSIGGVMGFHEERIKNYRMEYEMTLTRGWVDPNSRAFLLMLPVGFVATFLLLALIGAIDNIVAITKFCADGTDYYSCSAQLWSNPSFLPVGVLVAMTASFLMTRLSPAKNGVSVRVAALSGAVGYLFAYLLFVLLPTISFVYPIESSFLSLGAKLSLFTMIFALVGFLLSQLHQHHKEVLRGVR